MIQEKAFTASKTQGRIKACLLALNQMMKAPDKPWAVVIQETKDLVMRKRQERGAMEKPVFKNKDLYLQE